MTQHKFIQKYPNSENSFKMDYDTIHQNIDINCINHTIS